MSVEEKKGLPEVKFTCVDPEGKIRELEKENKMLRTLCMNKILELFEKEMEE